MLTPNNKYTLQICFALACLVQLVSTEVSARHKFNEIINTHQLSKLLDWDQFKRLFSKVYSSGQEELARKLVFAGNALKISTHNMAFRIGLTSYYMRVNQYADRTPQELAPLSGGVQSGPATGAFPHDAKQLSRLAGLTPSEDSLDRPPFGGFETGAKETRTNRGQPKPKPNGTDQSSTSASRQDSPVLRDYMLGRGPNGRGLVCGGGGCREDEQRVFRDWRESGCFARVGKQSACGSCFAFASLAVMEFWHCMDTGTLIEFSVQYMIDCGKYSGQLGCDGGGTLSSAGRFIMDWGVELADGYPYLDRNGACPYGEKEWPDAGSKRPVLVTYRWANNRDRWARILDEIGPILVGIRTPSDFHLYGGLVHSGNNCRRDEVDLHAMVVVGHGVANGLEYWLMRNSLGEQWGEEGYFKMSKEAPERCFVEATMARARFSAKPTQQVDGKRGKKLRPSEALIKDIIRDLGPWLAG